jgi:hypothetical protein
MRFRSASLKRWLADFSALVLAFFIGVFSLSAVVEKESG